MSLDLTDVNVLDIQWQTRQEDEAKGLAICFQFSSSSNFHVSSAILCKEARKGVLAWMGLPNILNS